MGNVKRLGRRAMSRTLSADSSNATLQSKLTRAKNAKAAEKRVLP
jgi:hypothetical protein